MIFFIKIQYFTNISPAQKTTGFIGKYLLNLLIFLANKIYVFNLYFLYEFDDMTACGVS
jgi:hypothetical protein